MRIWGAGRAPASGGVWDWDAEPGDNSVSVAPLLELSGHTDAVYAVNFSADGRRLVTGCDDSKLRVWDAESGCTTLTVPSAGWITSAAFSPDGLELVASGSVRVRGAAGCARAGGEGGEGVPLLLTGDHCAAHMQSGGLPWLLLSRSRSQLPRPRADAC